MDSQRVGTAHELLAAADLLKRGFDVYLAFNVARNDLVIVKERSMWRVQVGQ